MSHSKPPVRLSAGDLTSYDLGSMVTHHSGLIMHSRQIVLKHIEHHSDWEGTRKTVLNRDMSWALDPRTELEVISADG